MLFLLLLNLIGFLAIYYSEAIIYSFDKIKIERGQKGLVIVSFFIFSTYINHHFDLVSTVFFLIVFLNLYMINLIDKQEGIIPDKYSAIIFFIGIINVFFSNFSIYYIVLSFLPIMLLIVLILGMEKVYNTELMGGGDMKLLSALSIGIGLENILALLFLSHLFYLLRKKKGKSDFTPFGPYIYAGYLFTFAMTRVYQFIIQYNY